MDLVGVAMPSKKQASCRSRALRSTEKTRASLSRRKLIWGGMVLMNDAPRAPKLAKPDREAHARQLELNA